MERNKASVAGRNSYPQLSSEELISLAPLELPNYREDRFRGDGSRSHLSEYEEPDREILARIYQVLQSVFEKMQQERLDPAYIGRVLIEHAPHRDLIAADTRQLGVATLRTNQSRRLAQVIHDTRGGALQSLLIRWEMSLVFPDPLLLKKRRDLLRLSPQRSSAGE